MRKESLQGWVQERLLTTHSLPLDRRLSKEDPDTLGQQVRILTQLVALRLSAGLPLTVEGCWVPGLVRKCMEFKNLLARMTRDYRDAVDKDHVLRAA